ncbi:hypothetical protein UFOVP1492_75 [uncultured Caudovirales phage]|uniref:Uncharacterized protein n=1 Tax=uncultured Caudovirales phage TaxID=2100421 RepID=A0A6J7XPV2_9CAUD|nr:hypothetical protein UFOVP1127_59 [uncultured Caudovirales phage]CAB4193054.1 hypothetical protein UFOVP1242_15 [uncultured Caudovirales phage]CAB4217733.1 hypothetical protein UFOVP1492_75 [uncultured Caudovirales phage]CAB5231553.1 hypothetical protein UFOVP1580_104 [uncultured Caudovirales phage]
MNRKKVPMSKVTAADIDVLVPITVVPDFDSECFGKMWDLRSSDCAGCAASELCGLFYRDTVAAKVRKHKADQKRGLYLDEQDFSFDNAKLLSLMEQRSGDLDIQDIVEAVEYLSKSKDDVAVGEYVKRLLRENGFKTVSGIIHKKTA